MNTRRPRLLSFFLGTALAVWLSGGCSVSDERREPVGAQRLPDPVNCPTAQFEQACDPDGTGTQYTECQGLCVSSPDSPSGQIICRPISELGLANLAGYTCGSGPKCSQT